MIRLDYDHDWGLRGERRVATIFLTREPKRMTIEDYVVAKLRLKHFKPEALTVSVVRPGTIYRNFTP